MERNRRIAKAYARKHLLTINGSQDDYMDGTTLGLNSFDNPDRDAKTSHIKQYIGQGIRVRINQNGDIFVKRFSKANVFLHKLHQSRRAIGDIENRESDKSGSDLYAANSDIYGVIGAVDSGAGQSGLQSGRRFGNRQEAPLNSSSGDSSCSSNNKGNISNNTTAKSFVPNYTTSVVSRLELDKLVKVFDMQTFKSLLEFEARQSYPNRIQLRNMCISVISFVLNDNKLLNLPSWIMIINMVALDLIRREIGLIDPHDMPGMSQTPHLDDYQVEYDQELDANKKLTRMRRLVDSNRQLTASKRAFANAAALGAYNGDYYSASYENYNDFQDETAGRENETEVGKLKINGNNNDKNNSHKNDTNERQPQQQQQQHLMSSSSSGFNSHCSSHNDSSAASSRSNIAAPKSPGDVQQATNTALLVAPDVCPQSKDGLSTSCTALNYGNSCLLPSHASDLAAPTKNKSRGLRPAKMPHGVAPPGGQKSAPSSGPANISSPIPIPAPPTGAGGPATGKANLILVSPTGLSPPLTKRKSLAGSASNTSNPIETSDPMGDAGGRPRRLPPVSSLAPEFASIKYMDENGHLLDKSLGQRHKLPAGIPAYAQLAPPATRKHILRYLMSAASADMSKPPVQVSSRQLPHQKQQQQQRRPLPVLPFQKVPQQVARPLGGYMLTKLANRSDESLYYCGLQARVPNHRSRPVPLASRAPPPPPPIYPITRSAINAMLADFKLNQLHRLYPRNTHHHQHDPFMANLAKNSPKFMSLDNVHQSSLSSSSSASTNAKLADHPQSGGQTSDNIHDGNYSSPRKSSSFLNHVGGFLKRSKVKRSPVGLDLK